MAHAETITTGNFFQETLDQVPEFSSCVAAAMESNALSDLDPEDLDHLKYNPYSLSFELLTAILIPALNSTDPARNELLDRCFALLERVADSSDSHVRGNLSLAVTDFLLDPLGQASYRRGGPAFRALMAECLAANGQPVPKDWQR